MGKEYSKAFRYLGVEKVGVLQIDKREQASGPYFLDRLRIADVVMFSGGD